MTKIVTGIGIGFLIGALPGAVAAVVVFLFYALIISLSGSHGESANGKERSLSDFPFPEVCFVGWFVFGAIIAVFYIADIEWWTWF